MNCSSCGAVLPANSTICQYCKAHNPVDLLGAPGFSVTHAQTERICPDCVVGLQLLEVATKPACAVDRCPECGGLFLPPGGVGLEPAHPARPQGLTLGRSQDENV